MLRSYDPGLAGRAAGETVSLEGPEAHHLGRVRRARRGEPVALFDGRGHTARASVDELGRRAVVLRLDEAPVEQPPPALAVTLACAVPKGKRLRWLLEKLTELEVSRFVPLATERGVVDPSVRKDRKAGKFEAAAIEAAKQCGAPWLPEFGDPCDLAAALANEAAGARLLLTPDPAAPLLGEVAGGLTGPVVAFVGPEGGFTPAEEEQLLAGGATAVRLCRPILRVETAAIAVLAALRAIRG